MAAAALNYFDKSLDSLTIAEAAYLAALAKGPSNYHPIRRSDAAIIRRNWVLGQMARNQFITAEEAAAAKNATLIATGRTISDLARADYFAEEVLRVNGPLRRKHRQRRPVGPHHFGLACKTWRKKRS